MGLGIVLDYLQRDCVLVQDSKFIWIQWHKIYLRDFLSSTLITLEKLTDFFDFLIFIDWIFLSFLTSSSSNTTVILLGMMTKTLTWWVNTQIMFAHYTLETKFRKRRFYPSCSVIFYLTHIFYLYSNLSRLSFVLSLHFRSMWSFLPQDERQYC